MTDLFQNVFALAGSWVIAFALGHLTGATIVTLIKSFASRLLPK